MATPAPDELYRGATRIFASIILGFGVAIVVITLARGGGLASTGIWIGLVFAGIGAGRLYLALRSPD